MEGDTSARIPLEEVLGSDVEDKIKVLQTKARDNWVKNTKGKVRHEKCSGDWTPQDAIH